jgi:hypothetical protein
MLREPMLLMTHRRLNGSAMPVERNVILLIDAPIRTHALISQL